MISEPNYAVDERSSANGTWRLPFPVLLYPDPDGGYVAEIPQLRGCLAQGETEFECLTELERVMELWLATEGAVKAPTADTDRFVERIRLAVNG